jgi:hypothetical protein
VRMGRHCSSEADALWGGRQSVTRASAVDEHSIPGARAKITSEESAATRRRSQRSPVLNSQRRPFRSDLRRCSQAG